MKAFHPGGALYPEGLFPILLRCTFPGAGSSVQPGRRPYRPLLPNHGPGCGGPDVRGPDLQPGAGHGSDTHRLRTVGRPDPSRDDTGQAHRQRHG